MDVKWGIKLNPETILTSQIGAHPEKKSVTGGQPARTRKRQMTTDRIKLITWFLVRDDVIHPTLR